MSSEQKIYLACKPRAGSLGVAVDGEKLEPLGVTEKELESGESQPWPEFTFTWLPRNRLSSKLLAALV